MKQRFLQTPFIGLALLTGSIFLSGNVFSQDSTVIKTTADAYTFDRANSADPNAHSTNYGSDSYLVAKYGGGTSLQASPAPNNYADYQRNTYLRFPTTGITSGGNIDKVYVRLRYYQRDSYYACNGTMISATTSFDESTITWDNQPTATDSINRTLNDPQTNTPIGSNPPIDDANITNHTYYFYLDITDYVKGLANGGGLPSDLYFVIQGISDGNVPGYVPGARGNTGRSFLSKEFGVDSLAPSLVVYYDASLPVDASALSASKTAKGVQLSWSTYSESNTSSFAIERSKDGKNFSTIGNVDAVGNSTLQHDYSFLDKRPLTGISYYRFKVIESNGNSKYSNVATINGAVQATNIIVYPNPVQSGQDLKISLSDASASAVSIFDVSGKIIKTQAVNGSANISISTSGIGAGVYFVKITNASGKSTGAAQKIIIK